MDQEFDWSQAQVHMILAILELLYNKTLFFEPSKKKLDFATFFCVDKSRLGRGDAFG